MTRHHCTQGILTASLVVVVLMSMFGCASRTRYLTVRIPPVETPEVQPLPLTAAVVIPESLRLATEQEQVNCPLSITHFVFQSGIAFEKGVVQVLTPVFKKLELVRERPKAEQYDVVIEPGAPDIEIEGHCELFTGEKPTLDARVSVPVQVIDRRDQVLFEATYASGMHTEERVLDVVGKAMAELLTVMAQGMTAAPKLHTYAGLPAPSPEPAETTVTPTPAQKPVPKENGPPPPKIVHAPLPMVPEEKTNVTVGSGFAVGYGYVLTAYHLIAGMSYATVSYQNKAVPAALVLRERLSDIALLKVADGFDAQAQPGLRLGDGTKVKAGDRVWACDLSPRGTEKPLWKEGRVRPVLSQASSDPRFMFLLLASPVVHSGGPVLNDQGEVVGMIMAHSDVEQMFPNLGPLPADAAVAIKVQYAKWLLSMLPESEYILPAPTTRSVPVSTMIENARPQVVVIKSASR